MKLFIALWFAFSSAALAQNSDQRTTVFQFNQPTLGFELDQKDFETIFRTDQVPDTCYRDEVQGTRTECHTEYDRQCDMRYEQECYFRNYPVCNSVPRRVCHQTQQCTTQMDQVCNSQGCRNVPRRVCHPAEQCQTQMDQVCHNQQRYECFSVPRQYCQNIPRQACLQVPNIVKVPYACTRPVQVPIGQQLKLRTVARVTLNLINFSEVGASNDSIQASLENGVLKLNSVNPGMDQNLYQVIGEQRSEQVISSTEKVVIYSFTLLATPIQKLNALLEMEVSNGKLHYDRLEFSLNGTLQPVLKGKIRIVRFRRMRSDLVVLNQEFSSSVISNLNGNLRLPFNALGESSLKSGNHSVDLTLMLDQEKLKKGLVNPDALARISGKTISYSFEAFPAE